MTTVKTLVAAFKRRLTNADALAMVLKKHPHSKMSLSTVNWYRNRFRSEGLRIPSEHDLRK